MAFGPVTHDHTASQREDWGRRRLRTGAARVAREMRDTGANVGNGLRAEAMMRGIGSRNLGRMAEGMNPVTITRPTLRWCGDCRRDGRDPWQPLDHGHG